MRRIGPRSTCPSLLQRAEKTHMSRLEIPWPPSTNTNEKEQKKNKKTQKKKEKKKKRENRKN
jgi:hypothetical protein